MIPRSLMNKSKRPAEKPAAGDSRSPPGQLKEVVSPGSQVESRNPYEDLGAQTEQHNIAVKKAAGAPPQGGAPESKRPKLAQAPEVAAGLVAEETRDEKPKKTVTVVEALPRIRSALVKGEKGKLEKALGMTAKLLKQSIKDGSMNEQTNIGAVEEGVFENQPNELTNEFFETVKVAITSDRKRVHSAAFYKAYEEFMKDADPLMNFLSPAQSMEFGSWMYSAVFVNQLQTDDTFEFRNVLKSIKQMWTDLLSGSKAASPDEGPLGPAQPFYRDSFFEALEFLFLKSKLMWARADVDSFFKTLVNPDRHIVFTPDQVEQINRWMAAINARKK